MKLTKAQHAALQEMAAHTRREGWMFGPSAKRPTLAALRRMELVEYQHDGGRYIAHRINAAGRAALEESRK